MYLEFRMQYLRTNSTGRFQFSDTVQSFFPGIVAFALATENQQFFDFMMPFNVHQIGVDLDVEKTGSAVYVTPRLTNQQQNLSGSTDYDLDRAGSWVVVAVVAWTGASDGAYLMTTPNLAGIDRPVDAGHFIDAYGTAISSFCTAFPGYETATGLSAGVSATQTRRDSLSVSGYARMPFSDAVAGAPPGVPSHIVRLQAGAITRLEPEGSFGILPVSATIPMPPGHSMNFTTSVTFPRRVYWAVAVLNAFNLNSLVNMRCPVVGAVSYSQSANTHSVGTSIAGDQRTVDITYNIIPDFGLVGNVGGDIEFLVIAGYEPPTRAQQMALEEIDRLVIPGPPPPEKGPFPDLATIDLSDLEAIRESLRPEAREALEDALREKRDRE